MKKITAKATRLALVFCIFIASTVLAQWPTNPAINLLLSNTAGEATITRVAATHDGGCYVGWWDNTSGSYRFYLQRLNARGEIQWQPNGLLIDSHTQETYLTDYDIAVDDSDCAVLAINDIRAGGDFDIYGYRISPSGAFLWGANGLTISSNTGLDAGQHIAITSLGNIAFAWQEDTIVHVRKVSPEGTDLWTPATKNLTARYGFSVPDITPSDSDGVIVQFLVCQAPGGMYAPKFLYAHKYNANGNDLWGSGGALVSNAGGFGLQMRPYVVTDESGGAFAYWDDSRGNIFHAYAQHILSGGTMQWTVNGVVVSTTVGNQQMNPAFVYHPATGDIMLFYLNTNSDQSLSGIYGQRFSSAGVRQWSNGGRALIAMNNQERLLINACPVGNDAVMTYLERPANDAVNARLKAMRIDTTGTQVWPSSPIPMTTTLSSRGYLNACVNQFDQVIAVWQDKRTDPDGDAYLQNINADGTFGSLPITDGFISGLVTRVDGTTPIESVLVSTYDSLAIIAQDTTSAVGRFSISVAPGTYHEIFSRTNYRDTIYSNIIVASNETTHVNIIMLPTGGCHYIVGDVNDNAAFNGVDVVYAVSYFKGGSPPPFSCECPPGHVWFLAGDVNASCSFNGVDVTYMVSYFKGGSLSVPCPDCPPLP